MKYLKTFEISHQVTKFAKLNESNTIHEGNIEDAITVDGVKIDLDYDMDCDDDYIIYTIYLNGSAIHKLANVGIIFDDIDYVELDDSHKIDIYQTSASVSNKKLQSYGADQTSDLDAADAYDLVESKIKFKFDKKFTAKEFVKYFNSLPATMGDEHIASLKSTADKDKHVKTVAHQKALFKFFDGLQDKDFYLFGRSEDYLTTLPAFKELKKNGVSLEDAVAYCLKGIGVEEWQKNPKVLKANSKTGILD